MTGYISMDQVVERAMGAWRPPPRLSLSEWAERHYVTSAEHFAEPGPWRTLPPQREIMDALTDPRVVQVSFKKSARVGGTNFILALDGYHMHQDPTTILNVQPTVETAEVYAKEFIAPMLRDCPVLAALPITDESPGRQRGRRARVQDTTLQKRFPGGVLALVGANSGAGFRMVGRRVVVLDEVDAYPRSAGDDGDPVRLAFKRAEAYADRKLIAISTPLLAGASRIEALFLEGDQRRYHVPCPQCGHMAPFVFTNAGEVSGHFMRWPEGRPRDACFVCVLNGCVIEHREKRAMLAKGKWVAAKSFNGHASFHMWAAYSYSPNSTWGDIAAEWVAAQGDQDRLRTFINTTLGETWKVTGEAPEWRRLYEGRREQYRIGEAPKPVKVLTAGVDVQKDRFVYEVVGWGENKESWSVEAGELHVRDTADESAWQALDELLQRDFGGSSIRMLAVDSGYNTNKVYSWVRSKQPTRVIAVKGVAGAAALVSRPSKVEVKINGVPIKRGCRVWPVGVDLAKEEFYGWLRLERPAPGAPLPAGWCHFPQYGEDYFRQITAEHLVKVTDKKGFARYEWRPKPGEENHFLDCRVYARAAAALLGVDRRRPDASPGRTSVAAAQATTEEPHAPSADSVRPSPRRPGSFLNGGRGRGRRWL